MFKETETEVYTDGSCADAEGAGAVAGYGCYFPQSEERLCGRVPGRPQTAQRAEVCAVCAALSHTEDGSRVRLFTDSQYVVSQFEKLGLFRANGAEGEAHSDLWRQIALLTRSRKVEVEKVKAHTGVEGNEEADRLANQGRRNGPVGNFGLDSFPEEFANETVDDWAPTTPELRHAQAGLRAFKAAGPDGLRAETLKKVADPTSVYAAVREAWTAGPPSMWCDTSISMIPKKSGGERMIAVTNSILRMLSSVARARLQQCPLHEAQYGFRPHRSALFPIVGMKLLVQRARHAGRTLYAVFVDIKEAFYSLDRQKLFVLLEKAGVGPALFHVLQRTYELERAAVRSGSRYSENFKTTRGVKAGDSVSPTLFILAIDAVLRQMGQSKLDALYFYADDGALASYDLEVLQEALDRMASYMAEIGLRLSVAKTKAIAFCPHKPSIHVSKEVYENWFLNQGDPSYVNSRQKRRVKVVCRICGTHVTPDNLKHHQSSRPLPKTTCTKVR